jgi:hypothetical protein
MHYHTATTIEYIRMAVTNVKVLKLVMTSWFKSLRASGGGGIRRTGMILISYEIKKAKKIRFCREEMFHYFGSNNPFSGIGVEKA